jgi:hypothetical protein
MHQLEIQFFWPLTEQIPLDLDYSNCVPKRTENNTTYSVLASTGSYVLIDPITTWSTHISIDENNFVLNTNKEILWYRKILFKLLGIKLEKK